MNERPLSLGGRSLFVKMFGKSSPTNEKFVFPTIDRTAFFGYNK